VKNGILSVANSTRYWIKIPWTGLGLHFDYVSCDVHEHRARVQTVIWLANLLHETIAWFLLCLHTLTYLLQPTQGFWSSRICETSPHGSAQEAHLTQPLELYETSHATSSGGSNMRIAAHLCKHRKWGTISSPPIKGWWKVAFGPRTLCDATAQLCRTSDRPTPSSVVPGNYSSPAPLCHVRGVVGTWVNGAQIGWTPGTNAKKVTHNVKIGQKDKREFQMQLLIYCAGSLSSKQ